MPIHTCVPFVVIRVGQELPKLYFVTDGIVPRDDQDYIQRSVDSTVSDYIAVHKQSLLAS